MLKYISFKDRETFPKIVLVLCFLLMISVLLLAHNSPATGYESSIYKYTPISIWISIILSFTVGCSIVVLQVYYQKLQQSYLWKIGVTLVYFNYIFCISLFIIRGYYSWCINGDPASHIGDVYKIISSGYLGSELFYPIMHIYTTQLSLILGLNLIYLHKIIPLFFGVLYIPLMYLFVKSILQEKDQVLMATLASFTFLNGWYLNFTPNGFSNLLFPLVLYCTVKLLKGGIEWEILILIMAFLYPIFHPVPSIVFVILVVFLPLPQKIFFKLSRKQYYQESFAFPNIKYTLLLILFVWGVTWISSFYVWENTLINIHRLLVEGGQTHLNQLASQINYAHGYGYSVTKQVFKKLGGVIAYSLLTFACGPIIWKKLSKSPDDVKLNNLFAFYGPFIAIGIFILFNYTLNLGFGPLRFVTYITLIATPFVGFYLAIMMKRFKNRKGNFFPILSIIFILGMFVLGALNVYPSSYVLEMSQQTTKSEFVGMNWLFDHREVDIPISGISAAPYRFVKLLPPSEIERQKIPPWGIPSSIKPPSNHFGYNSTNSMLSTYYIDDVYLLILEKDKSIYVDIFPEMADIRWTLDDFKRINLDRSVDKTYSNREFTVYYINS